MEPLVHPKLGHQGPSVGEYLLVPCINRCVAPRSKSKIGQWYDKTVLPSLIGIKSSGVIATVRDVD